MYQYYYKQQYQPHSLSKEVLEQTITMTNTPDSHKPVL